MDDTRVARVLFLQRQPCIRAMKYAVALREHHPGIELGFAYQGKTLTGWYGAGDDLFTHWWHLSLDDTEAAFAQIVDEFAPDVVHSHNLPDVLTVMAVSVLGDSIPVVHDVHDLQSLRRTPYEDGFADPVDPLQAEAEAIAGAAAVIAVSREMLDAIEARHGRPERVRLFANLALARDISRDTPPRPAPDDDGERPLRVVYQGSVSDNGSHYDLREQFAAIAAAGLTIDIYPNRDAPAYHELAARTPGMTVHDTLPPAELLRRLPAYDVGWAAFNTGLNGAHLDTALPNKAFEYLASGLPIAAGRHKALEGLIREHGVGVVVDHPAELPAALAAAGIERLRARVAERRHHFTVESNIDALVHLYRECVEARAEPVGSGRAQGVAG